MIPSVTESDTMVALRSFLLNILPAGTDVIQAQINQVAEPSGQNFVMLTPLQRERISTNIDTWDQGDPAATLQTVLTPIKFTTQLDLHGPSASDNCHVVQSLLRDGYACDYFTKIGYDIQPLYADDAIQMAFIDGEAQYEDRWTMNAVLQINPVISTPQQFADTLTVGLIEIDTVYPP